ncbi:hypothetical protein BDV23DRAFT_184420 [Aspergillus alliaceus]|uniref:Alcohol dehydrogenase-like N-terminal domain-containing protein n=1 Tax=Petromyces alliaceus TaxID=209559 RepID=A0A5N7C5X1_PETAA|nr:hypothetical protein BDV23DRAFT_184420 [Aspergillus alliaceus]
MPRSNCASWLMAKQSPVNVVDTAPYTSPSAGELVIKTKAIALNLADVGVQKLGILLGDYRSILGCDVAGEFVQAHASLAGIYAVGNRVIGGWRFEPKGRQILLLGMPTEVAYEDAAVLPLGINTAASSLFAEETLGLDVPSVDGTKPPRGKMLLVWGASSSVGACGVQMATQAGYDVRDPTLVDDIVAFLDGKEVAGAYGAITSDSALNATCEILDRSGGRKLVASVIPGAEEKATNSVKVVTNFATDIANSGVGNAIWQWLSSAMGYRIKYMPQSEVVGKGLEQVQEAVDLLAHGVSAKKLVVSI